MNSDALRWLDAEGNGTTNLRTRKPPRVMFREEARHRVQFSDEGFSEIRSVSDKYTVKIDWSVYELTRTAVKPFDQVRVEEQDGMQLFYKAAENELIHKLGELALKGGYRVYYCNIDVFLQILRHKDTVDKYYRKFQYMISCDLIIIDELIYVALSEQDLPLFYRAVNFLKEERSVIYITNRELSEWPQVADDKHLMETLTQKIMSSSQQIRLQ